MSSPRSPTGVAEWASARRVARTLPDPLRRRGIEAATALAGSASRAGATPAAWLAAALETWEEVSMTKYETPQVVASYSIDELVEEAAVCTGYDGTPTKTVP